MVAPDQHHHQSQQTAPPIALERGNTGPADGYTNPQTMTVRIGGHHVDAQAVTVLAHELGHIE